MTPPLVLGPVQAYRSWHIRWHYGQPVLGSVFHSTLWPASGPLHATCERGTGLLTACLRRFFSSPQTHAAPEWGCECGVYALARLDGDPGPRLSPAYESGGIRVKGVVLLWGRVIQHTQGYRAEYARPLKLLAASPLAHDHDVRLLLQAIAQRYGLSLVRRMEELADSG
jgi:hypothetical protein